MAREVYTDEEFIKFSTKFVFMRVFSDVDRDGAQLKEKYQVQGVPTLLILDSRGKEVDRLLGFRTAEVLIEDLEFIFEHASKRGRFRL
jgi:thioredoxin-related protein